MDLFPLWYIKDIISLASLLLIGLIINIVTPGWLFYRKFFKNNKLSPVEIIFSSIIFGILIQSVLLRLVAIFPFGVEIYIKIISLLDFGLFIIILFKNRSVFLSKINRNIFSIQKANIFNIILIILFISPIFLKWISHPAFYDNVSIGYTIDLNLGSELPPNLSSNETLAWGFRHGWSYSALILATSAFSFPTFSLYNGSLPILIITLLAFIYFIYSIGKAVNYNKKFLSVFLCLSFLLISSQRSIEFLHTGKSSILSFALFLIGVIFSLKSFNSNKSIFQMLAGLSFGLTYDIGISGILFTVIYYITIPLLNLNKESWIKFLNIGYLIGATLLWTNLVKNLNLSSLIILIVYLLIIWFFKKIKSKILLMNFNSKLIYTLWLCAVSISIFSLTFGWSVNVYPKYWYLGEGILKFLEWNPQILIPFFYALVVLITNIFISRKKSSLSVILQLVLIALILPGVPLVLSQDFFLNTLSSIGLGSIKEEIQKSYLLWDMSRSILIYLVPFIISITSSYLVTQFIKKVDSKILIYTILSASIILIFQIPNPNFSDPLAAWDYGGYLNYSYNLSAVKQSLANVRKNGNIISESDYQSKILLLDGVTGMGVNEQTMLSELLTIQTNERSQEIVFVLPSMDYNNWGIEDVHPSALFAWGMPQHILGRQNIKFISVSEFLPDSADIVVTINQSESIVAEVSSYKLLYSNASYSIYNKMPKDIVLD